MRASGRPHGLQSEVLVSLAILMLAATCVLGALLVRMHEWQLSPLRLLAARALVENARGPLPHAVPGIPAMRWWVVEGGGRVRNQGGEDAPLPGSARALADESRSLGRPLLRAGHPWQQTIFASQPDSGGRVAVAVLPPAIRAFHLLAVLATATAVFTAFGFGLLRRRIVVPLQRLSGAARAIADGDWSSRVPVDPVRETAAVATAFNEMGEALEGRTTALEKAVTDLRESNRHLREAREGLDRAERLAAVGRLAAGVAHEVGNPMGALLAFLDLASRDAGLSEAGREHLERAAREGERVRSILRQLLDFSRPKPAESRPVDVSAICEETAELVRAQRRYAGIAIRVEGGSDAPPALADPGRVVQIVLNLLLNAADAILGSGTGGTIRVVVRGGALRVRGGEGGSAAAARRRPDAVECRVEDDGPGVDPEHRESIFDPFFTTKDPGEGTGLGLANASRAAEEMGGSLVLDPEHARGAAFVLRLPTPPPSPETGAREAGRAPAREVSRDRSR